MMTTSKVQNVVVILKKMKLLGSRWAQDLRASSVIWVVHMGTEAA